MSIQHWVLEGGGAKQWGWRNSVCENTHCDWLDSIYILVLQFVISPYQLTLSAEAERRTGKCNREREREREKGGREGLLLCAALLSFGCCTAQWQDGLVKGGEKTREWEKEEREKENQLLQPDRKERENKGRMELAFSSLQERKSCTFVLSSMLSLFSHPVLNALR